MSWFSRFKNVNVRRDEALSNAIQRISYAWKAVLREHESASREYLELKRLWEENTEKGRQTHSLLSLERHEEGLIGHADSKDHSADQALKAQNSFVKKREANTNRLYSLVVEQNRHLGSANKSIQDSDHLSKTELLQRIQSINAALPKIADLNLDPATHADNYNRAIQDIAHIEDILRRKDELSKQRSLDLTQLERLSEEEAKLEKEDSKSINEESTISDKIKKFERKEKKKEKEIGHEQKDEKTELSEFKELKAA